MSNLQKMESLEITEISQHTIFLQNALQTSTATHPFAYPINAKV